MNKVCVKFMLLILFGGILSKDIFAFNIPSSNLCNENYFCNRRPTPAITTSSLNTSALKDVNLNGNDSFDGDGFILKYEWDFGDGTFGTGPSVTHQFKEPGNYKIKLKVTDNNYAFTTTSIVMSVGGFFSINRKTLHPSAMLIINVGNLAVVDDKISCKLNDDNLCTLIATGSNELTYMVNDSLIGMQNLRFKVNEIKFNVDFEVVEILPIPNPEEELEKIDSFFIRSEESIRVHLNTWEDLNKLKERRDEAFNYFSSLNLDQQNRVLAAIKNDLAMIYDYSFKEQSNIRIDNFFSTEDRANLAHSAVTGGLSLLTLGTAVTYLMEAHSLRAAMKIDRSISPLLIAEKFLLGSAALFFSYKFAIVSVEKMKEIKVFERFENSFEKDELNFISSINNQTHFRGIYRNLNKEDLRDINSLPSKIRKIVDFVRLNKKALDYEQSLSLERKPYDIENIEAIYLKEKADPDNIKNLVSLTPGIKEAFLGVMYDDRNLVNFSSYGKSQDFQYKVTYDNPGWALVDGFFNAKITSKLVFNLYFNHYDHDNPLKARLSCLSAGNAGPPDSCEWDFGDGSQATGTLVYHTFPANGLYKIRIKAIWPYGDFIFQERWHRVGPTVPFPSEN